MPPKKKFAQQHNPLTKLVTVISLLLVIAGTLGLLFLQQPLREPQVIEKKAAAPTPDPFQVSLQATPVKIALDQKSTIVLSLDAQQRRVTDVQLLFHLVTETFDASHLEIETSQFFTTTQQEIQETPDGMLVLLHLSPNPAEVTGTRPSTLTTLNFTPQQAGFIELNVDTDQSRVIVRGLAAEPAPKLMADPHYFVVNKAKAAFFDQDATDSARITQPQVKGVSTQCNATCVNNSQCPNNYRCYHNYCRLASNISNTSCQTATTDNTEQASCGGQCQTNRDCAQGLSCYNNRCSHPENVASATCQAPDAATQQTTAQECNSACTSNRDCAVNLSCHSGSCRLATNPSSLSCSSATKTTLTDRYSKGGGPQDQLTEGKPANADEAMTKDSTQEDQTQTEPENNRTVDQDIKDKINDFLNKWSLSVSFVSVVIGVVLLAILAFIFLKKLIGGGNKPPSPSGKQPDPSSYEYDLQEKIQSLKSTPNNNQPAQPTPPPPPTLTNSSSPFQKPA